MRVGQMLMVFVYRVEQQLKLLAALPQTAKFSGATGGFNAHVVAYPNIDWIEFGNKYGLVSISRRIRIAHNYILHRFISSLGLEREQWTTQISNYDNLSALLDNARRINTYLTIQSTDSFHASLSSPYLLYPMIVPWYLQLKEVVGFFQDF